MGEAGRFYRTQDQAAGTHLALRWNGRVRYTVPHQAAAREACWKTFQPGHLEFIFRAMAGLPRLLGSVGCVEGEKLASIRQAIGKAAGLSCCRTGAPGVWSKDTILLLDEKTTEPLYIVKAGVGEAVDSLLQNEAVWLRTLLGEASLAGHIPKLVAHLPGVDLSFVAESPLSGKLEHGFGELHVVFLRKLQEQFREMMRFEDTRLYRDLRSRLKDLDGLLSEAWSARLERVMLRIEQSLSGPAILFVAAHNDFTPWNIRVERGVAKVFDWEYADYEQLPLFDPLHFALLPMASKSRPADRMLRAMSETMLQCRKWLGEEACVEPQAQALAYLTNLCTLYLWSDRGAYESHPVLVSYAEMIDQLCPE